MWLYVIAKFVCMTAFLCFFDLEYQGLENIPSKGPYIMACNHRSNLDPILLAHKIPQRICYMGKMELFKNPILGWALRTIGTFPVDRGKGDSSAIDRSQEVLRRGEVLGIFPEGHRSKTGEPLRPKSGCALIAKLTQADILPCAIYFEGKLGFRRKIVIRYGELIPFSQLGLEGDSPRDLRNGTKVMFDRVLTLVEECKHGY